MRLRIALVQREQAGWQCVPQNVKNLLADAGSDTHECVASIFHDGSNIRKVDVN
jgi:hypothetical protein